MMNDRFGVNSNGNPQAAQDTQGFQNSSTPPEGTTADPVLTSLNQLKSEMAAVRQENAQLKSQIQSVDDRTFNRVMKQMRGDQAALRRTAELEGWDEATLSNKIQAANQKALGSLSLAELQDTNTQTQPAPEAPTAPNGFDNLQNDMAHAMALKQYVNSLGLSDTDLGPQGVMPYAGKAPGSVEHKEFTKLVARKLEEKEELARQMAQRYQRQQIADEVAAEMADSGGLGGMTGGRTQGAGAAQSNFERILEQEKAKFRGTGRMVEWMQRERQLYEQYGLKPPR